jgi:hypothetical protein
MLENIFEPAASGQVKFLLCQEWIRSLLLTDGGRGTVTRVYPGIRVESKQFFAYAADQAVVIPSRKIRPSDALQEQYISRDQEFLLRAVQQDPAG